MVPLLRPMVGRTRRLTTALELGQEPSAARRNPELEFVNKQSGQIYIRCRSKLLLRTSTARPTRTTCCHAVVVPQGAYTYTVKHRNPHQGGLGVEATVYSRPAKNACAISRAQHACRARQSCIHPSSISCVPETYGTSTQSGTWTGGNCP